METSKLKKFAQYARRSLMEQVEAKLKLVLTQSSAARRESPKVVEELEKLIKASSRDQVIERVAYIWFNRFCALRFMDVNRYTKLGIISPLEGQVQPELIAEAKMGHIDEDVVSEETRNRINGILGGSIPSKDPQTEAYRLLIVAYCNDYSRAMPYLFEEIADYTELLMPDDLLSGNSILAYTREAMTPDACKDVEVIGWLYQFYISEKSDIIRDELKKKKKITPENIPAATQLFTPHWIVRYLVENSLGRLWMLNHPESKLIEKMDYYIKPEEAETNFLKIGSPEELKICDPACGSGHMLTYAFDLLYTIYAEEGYSPTDIPEKILTKNLFGIEIDERAGELAAFALTMKAREKQRRFFRSPVKPNICVLQKINFEASAKEYAKAPDLFDAKVNPDREWEKLISLLIKEGIKRDTLLHDLRLYEEADNFGSLLRPKIPQKLIPKLISLLEKWKQSDSLFVQKLAVDTERVMRQSEYLSARYDVIVTNPPYLGSKGYNQRLGAWAKDFYPNSKADLFAMFIERCGELTAKQGLFSVITMQSWMFLATYEKFRIHLLANKTILSMVHLGPRAFDSIGGEIVSTTAFVVEDSIRPMYQSVFVRVVEGASESDKQLATKGAIKSPTSDRLFFVSAMVFKKIPGSPIAYWAPKSILNIFAKYPKLKDICEPKSGLSTTDNDRFLRYWSEVNFSGIQFTIEDRSETCHIDSRWYPFCKGGDFRKWSGNMEYVVDWRRDGTNIRQATRGAAGGRIVSPECYFKPGITWSGISSSVPSARLMKNSIFGSGGKALFSNGKEFLYLGFLNSKVALLCMTFVSPTLNFETGHIGSLPIIENEILSNCESRISHCVQQLVCLSQEDWNSYERSWDFADFPLLRDSIRQEFLRDTYNLVRSKWQEMTLEAQNLESVNNSIFISCYGLNDELSPDVQFQEISLSCNPIYRYKEGGTEEELEALLLADTMKELISYAVGCMFGRYALDKPGLILANQGETIQDYLKQIPVPRFPADEDNVIPMLDDNWFTDDIVDRFGKFIKVAFGDKHHAANMKFIEKAIGKDLRKYFVKDFYSDHIKRYKKRPIYWLFSSPKGSFNALIYMHRYRPDTVSVVLNNYLREFKTKLLARLEHLKHVEISASASSAEKTKAMKEIDKLNTVINELEAYERDVLYPLAAKRIEIDLDDGVKVNYLKFGDALKKIPGLEAKED